MPDGGVFHKHFMLVAISLSGAFEFGGILETCSGAVEMHG